MMETIVEEDAEIPTDVVWEVPSPTLVRTHEVQNFLTLTPWDSQTDDEPDDSEEQSSIVLLETLFGGGTSASDDPAQTPETFVASASPSGRILFSPPCHHPTPIPQLQIEVPRRHTHRFNCLGRQSQTRARVTFIFWKLFDTRRDQMGLSRATRGLLYYTK